MAKSGNRSARAWLDEVKRAEAMGDCLRACDLATRGLEEHRDSIWLKHRSVLALARSGATSRAATRFDELGLGERPEEDIAALRARIHKDEAMRASGPDRTRLARQAAESYAAIHARTGGHYPGVNAATMFLLSGDPARSRDVALSVRVSEDESPFYQAATRAELALLREDTDAAAAAIAQAAQYSGQDYAALASTRGQLRLVCAALGLDAAILAPLAGPLVVHYTGHRVLPGGPFRPSDEEQLAARVRAAVATSGARIGFGSLASGADILFAEALLDSGAALHVVLPFDPDEFRAVSVAPAGEGWLTRFGRCFDAAVSVHLSTDGAWLGDSALFAYAHHLAMGLALVRARHLGTAVAQLALWDGRPARGVGGTGDAVERWQALGFPATILSVDGPSDERSPAPASEPGRVVRALLFGDVRGFSRLTETQLQPFFDLVLPLWARILDGHGSHVLHRNTWGDGLYVVLDDVPTAARCALELQRAMAELDAESHGLPGELSMRIGGHAGPVFTGHNPVIGRAAFYGTHVTRTARIEPATLPGEVYVTAAFAGLLALSGVESRCDYVGEMPAAKGYGRFGMYLLNG